MIHSGNIRTIMRIILDLIGYLHQKIVFNRRAEALAHQLSQHLDEGDTVLDVGCGNGTIAALIHKQKPGSKVIGIDVHPRPSCGIPCTLYDGKTIPFPDRHFDSVILVDVLHHTDDPRAVLAECSRVARKHILIKDHYCDSRWSYRVLAFMDWVGNRAWNVRLPYHYLSREEWKELFTKLSLDVRALKEEGIGLYPGPFKPLFENGLHFIAKLARD